MSTPKERKIFPTENILYGRNFTMQRERFSDTIKRLRMEKGLSLEDVRLRTGNKLATSYISRIENGQVPANVISIGILQKLAKGLGESVHSLFNSAIDFVPELSIDAERLNHFAQEMSPFRLRDLVDIGEMFLESERDGSSQKLVPMATLRTTKSLDEERKTG